MQTMNIVDVIQSSWNNILTILAFLFSSVVGIYQIKYYKDQSQDLEIVEISNSYCDGHQQAGSYVRTNYDLNVGIQNNGRNKGTITGAKLFLDEYDDKIDLNNSIGRVHHWKNEDVESYINMSLKGTGKPYEEPTDPITGKIILESTDGDLKKEVSFNN
jgi:hypothetical protein